MDNNGEGKTTTQNTYKRSNVSTTLMMLWGGDSKQLRVTGQNDGMTIAIWEPAYTPEGGKKYPQDSRFQLSLRPSTVSAINSLLSSNVLSAYAAGIDCNIAVPTNMSGVSVLEIGIKNKQFYLNLYFNCNPETKCNGECHTFNFERTLTYKDYDPSANDITPEWIDADFFLFVKCIKAYTDLVGGTISGHGSRVVGDYENNILIKYLTAIANKIGAELPNSNYSGTNTSYGRAQQAEPQISTKYTMTPVDDIDNFMA